MEKNNLDNRSLWRTGKDEYRKFMTIKLSKKTNFVSFTFGILFTAILIIPIACLVFQIIELYWFNRSTMFLFLAIAWALFMFCNGLSNYITVKIVKANEKDMTDIQSIDDKAIFFYQSFNIGFGAFILILLTYFGISV